MVNMAGIFSVHVPNDKIPLTILDEDLNNGPPLSALQIELPLLTLPSTQSCDVVADDVDKTIFLAGS